MDFRFHWSVFYNQTVNQMLAAVFRDHIRKYLLAIAMSYFEQVLEEEQLPVTSQNKSSSPSSLHSVSVH